MFDSRSAVGTGLALCFVALLACKKGESAGAADAGADAGAGTQLEQKSAFCAGSCTDEGKCAKKIVRDAVLVGGRMEVKETTLCIAADDADCKASRFCKLQGDCALTGEECKPKDDADCAKSERCKLTGNCSKTTVCAVTGAKDCTGEVCTKRGHCKFVSLSPTHGRCEPASSADCKKSPACAESGACASVRGSSGGLLCGAGTDADCRASRVCKAEQRCRRGQVFEDFACVK